MPDGFTVLQRKAAQLEREFSGEASKKRLERVARQTKTDVDEAVRDDLGDLSMSGWPRGNIVGRYDVLSDHEFEINPVPRSRGPMRVLEQGRNQGNASGFAGPGINTRTGLTARNKNGSLRKVRARKGKRWNGRTEGKGTWTDAAKLMSERVPDRVDSEVQKAIGKFFKKG
jgi:hypothetical protein